MNVETFFEKIETFFEKVETFFENAESRYPEHAMIAMGS